MLLVVAKGVVVVVVAVVIGVKKGVAVWKGIHILLITEFLQEEEEEEEAAAVCSCFGAAQQR